VNLLIVDDDPITRESYAALLRAEGYKVSLTNDGSEALSRLLRGTVDPNAILLGPWASPNGCRSRSTARL